MASEWLVVNVVGIGGSHAGNWLGRRRKGDAPPLRMAVLCALMCLLWGRGGAAGRPRVAAGNNFRRRGAGAGGELLPRTRGAAAPNG